jgi:membrane-associated phospholipid phosphatase
LRRRPALLALIGQKLRILPSLILAVALGAAGASPAASAGTQVGAGANTEAYASPPTADAADQSLPQTTAEEPARQQPGSELLTDIKLYFTAPLRWDTRDWAWFGGALLAIGAAHHYDTQVRTHFVKSIAPGQTISSHDVQDIAPAVAVVGLTFGYATLADDNNGRREAGTMVEAVALSAVTTYALKYITRREGPDETSNPNQWFKSHGNTFPSFHATAAFAVGTVLAESGNDEYRWLRRVLGYGLGVATSYERLKHNAHWLSDTVAGAAIGGATANFTMNRRDVREQRSSLSLVPVEGGAMLTYRLTLP